VNLSDALDKTLLMALRCGFPAGKVGLPTPNTFF
jgi:hypothetical protein